MFRRLLTIIKHRFFSLGHSQYRGAFLFVLLACIFANFSHALEIKDFRVGVQGDATRFVIELDQETPFRIFTLNKPERLIIDLPNSKLPADKKLDISQTLIKQYRTGLFRSNIHRIVLDLKQPVQIVRQDSLPSDKSFRIFIDIVPIDAEISKNLNFASNGWKEYACQC